jgi:hypothetical protein
MKRAKLAGLQRNPAVVLTNPDIRDEPQARVHPASR